jgi:hypothetical protein
MTYRVEFEGAALAQLNGLPSAVFDALVRRVVALAQDPWDADLIGSAGSGPLPWGTGMRVIRHPFVHAAQRWRGGRDPARYHPHVPGVDLAEVVVQGPLVVAGQEPVEQDRHRPPGIWRSGGPVSRRAGWAGPITGPAATTLLCAGPAGCATARGWARCG